MARLANSLRRRGLAVDLVVLDPTGPWREGLSAEVELVTLTASRASHALPELVAYLRRRRPAVLVSNLPHLNVVSALAHRLAGRPCRLVLVEHNDILARSREELGWRGWPLRKTMRLTYPWADRALAVSRGAADSLARAVNLPLASVGVLPNAVEIDRIQALAAEDVDHPWFTDGGLPVIVSAGRLVYQKGFGDLILAVDRLRRLPARLLILGEGPLRVELERSVRELALEDRVDFGGYRPNPYAYMARAAVFALASRYEGFGIVLLEAMTCGTPVVATDCPSGPNEVLAGGKAGLLVPVARPDLMADALERVLTDRKLAARLREAGLRRAQDFSLERVTDRFLEIVSDLSAR